MQVWDTHTAVKKLNDFSQHLKILQALHLDPRSQNILPKDLISERKARGTRVLLVFCTPNKSFLLLAELELPNPSTLRSPPKDQALSEQQEKQKPAFGATGGCTGPHLRRPERNRRAPPHRRARNCKFAPPRPPSPVQQGTAGWTLRPHPRGPG